MKSHVNEGTDVLVSKWRKLSWGEKNKKEATIIGWASHWFLRLGPSSDLTGACEHVPNVLRQDSPIRHIAHLSPKDLHLESSYVTDTLANLKFKKKIK
jgi:hypothetical protein